MPVPMPLVEPVTIATLPSSLFMMPPVDEPRFSVIRASQTQASTHRAPDAFTVGVNGRENDAARHPFPQVGPRYVGSARNNSETYMSTSQIRLAISPG